MNYKGDLKNMKYPKMITIDNINYYYIKEYERYAMYRSEYGIRECFTPCQVHDIYKSKFNKVEVWYGYWR